MLRGTNVTYLIGLISLLGLWPSRAAAQATANPTTPRTGTLTIAGKTLTVTQSAAACSFTLSSTAQSVPWSGGTVTTAVTTASGCSWTAVSNASWITVASGSGTASGPASYTVDVNKPKRVRTGTVTIAGQTVTITQLGNPPGKPTNVTIMVD